MMINGGGGGCGSGSDEDDVMMLMTTTMTTTKGSREICGRREEKDDRRLTLQTLLNYSFSISSRRIPIASLICSCFYHLPTDATRGMTSFRKKIHLFALFMPCLCAQDG